MNEKHKDSICTFDRSQTSQCGLVLVELSLQGQADFVEIEIFMRCESPSRRLDLNPKVFQLQL